VNDVLLYAGKRVVVTGCASGMGAAAAALLVELGAEVVGLDVKPTDVPVKQFLTMNLGDKASRAPYTRSSVSPVCPARRSPTSTRCSSTSSGRAT
jgi:NAD(P)-dependent dehydrogenase (short-subunit alcohol dehydrogenase family)